MTATYTWDVFATLDGFGTYDEHGDWGGYWGKQGPELEARRDALYAEPSRIVFGANTYREFVSLLDGDADAGDTWVTRMLRMPLTVVSTTLEGPLAWPGAELVRDDAVTVVADMKEASDVPLRSHGSLALNRSLMAAGLVDRLQLTVFPALSGRTGADPVFAGAEDFDLELLEQRTLDGRTLELTYRPSRHG